MSNGARISKPILDQAMFRCTVCGKPTNFVAGLCQNCYKEATLEREHMNGRHDEFVDGCPVCRQEEGDDKWKKNTHQTNS